MELLKKAEVLCERDRKGQATTFNNLAVYYRRQGKVTATSFQLSSQRLARTNGHNQKMHTHTAPHHAQVHAAMAYIQKALDLETDMKLPTAADTHLNMCAVLSQVGR